LIEVAGWRLLTDPTFDPPGRRYGFGFGSASTKLAGPSRPSAALGHVDAVLLSHDHHADNLDDAGRALLADVPTVVTTTSGARRLAAPNVRGLRPWQTTTLSAPGLPSLEITATPCRHGPPASRPIVGDVIGFAIRVVGSDRTAVWVSGDSVLYRGLREVADKLTVDVAVLHLGGVQFGITGGIRYSMTASEAITLIGLLNPRVAVPVHFDGWSHFREGEDRIRTRFLSAPHDIQSKVVWVPLDGSVALAD
ncbi:MAG: MBL fold metallo-hydrolase, partial [Pseudolysinimonas sp.]